MSRLALRSIVVSIVLAVSPIAIGVAADYPQWGGSARRNNSVESPPLADDWKPGKFDRTTGKWDPAEAKNVKWVARLGSQTFGTPVVADGRVFIGTNNNAGYLPHYSRDVDLGCLLCFRESDGAFLWQFSAEKLPTGRVHDWPLQGIASSPLVEQDRAWFVSNRGEVVCVDTKGFSDDEDDGPVVAEAARLFEWMQADDEHRVEFTALIAQLDEGELPAALHKLIVKAGAYLPDKVALRVDEKGAKWSFSATIDDIEREFHFFRQGPRIRGYRTILPVDKHEADVVWRFDMMKELGSSQHNLATCCIASWKDVLFVCTGNGVAEDHITIPAPDAPSFFAMDKSTGKVLWTDNSPGANIHHGQWSAPAVGLLGGIPQVIFCGGDGWVYSFHAEEWHNARPRLLWKFDTNAKDAVLEFGGRGARNEPIAPPVLHDNKVFVSTGQDPEHGEGIGTLWCIDATKKTDGSDVSPQKVIDKNGRVVPHRRRTNAPAWKESPLYGEGYDRAFDQGTVPPNFRETFTYRYGPLPGTIDVKPILKGAEWELKIGAEDARETICVWKRARVNDLGLRDHMYVIARKSPDRIVENSDSAVVWKYDNADWDGNGKIEEFYEYMHRTIASPVIHDELLFCPDFSGLLHCLDVKTGRRHWMFDQLAASWGTPLIASGQLYVGDEDGDVAIFKLSADPAKAGTPAIAKSDDKDFYPNVQPIREINMGNSIYCNPVCANGVLFITNKTHLFAIEAKPR